jgi:hypothetical protein
VAAALVLAVNLGQKWPNEPTRSIEERMGRLLTHRAEPRAYYRPLLDKTTIDFVWHDDDTPADASAVERLRRRLRDAANEPVSEYEYRDVNASIDVQPRFVSRDPETEWPCLVALGIARRAQLGIDGQAILDELPHVTTANLQWVAARPTAGVVLGVRAWDAGPSTATPTRNADGEWSFFVAASEGAVDRTTD